MAPRACQAVEKENGRPFLLETLDTTDEDPVQVFHNCKAFSTILYF